MLPHRLLIYLCTLLLSLPSLSWGQKDAECKFDMNQFLIERQQFFARELSLTESEADHLSRILTEADSRKIPLWRQLHQRQKALKAGKCTEAEAEEFIALSAKIHSDLAKIDEDIVKQLQKYIPSRKLINFHKINREFARQFTKRHGAEFRSKKE